MSTSSIRFEYNWLKFTFKRKLIPEYRFMLIAATKYEIMMRYLPSDDTNGNNNNAGIFI